MSSSEDTVEVHVPVLPIADPSSVSPCCERDGPDFDLEYAVSMVHNYVPPRQHVGCHQHVVRVSMNLPDSEWRPLLRQRGLRVLDANLYMQKVCKGSFDDKNCCSAQQYDWSGGPVKFPTPLGHKYYFKCDTCAPRSWQRDRVDYALFEDMAVGKFKQNLVIVRNVVVSPQGPSTDLPIQLTSSPSLSNTMPQRATSSTIEVPSSPSLANTMPQRAPSSARLIKKPRRSFEPVDDSEHAL